MQRGIYLIDIENETGIPLFQINFSCRAIDRGLRPCLRILSIFQSAQYGYRKSIFQRHLIAEYHLHSQKLADDDFQ